MTRGCRTFGSCNDTAGRHVFVDAPTDHTVGYVTATTCSSRRSGTLRCAADIKACCQAPGSCIVLAFETLLISWAPPDLVLHSAKDLPANVQDKALEGLRARRLKEHGLDDRLGALTTMFSSLFTASRLQVATYLFGVALFSISFLVFLNSSISFVVTDLIGQKDGVGDAVGTLGFADELVALFACPFWGIASDRLGIRMVGDFTLRCQRVC